MEPQAKRKKKQRKLGAIQDLLNGRVPITVIGQRYTAPEGRHSQQTHVRAKARAESAGHATVQEQHAADRAQLLSQMADTAAASARNKQQSQQK